MIKVQSHVHITKISEMVVHTVEARVWAASRDSPILYVLAYITDHDCTYILVQYSILGMPRWQCHVGYLQVQ